MALWHFMYEAFATEPTRVSSLAGGASVFGSPMPELSFV